MRWRVHCHQFCQSSDVIYSALAWTWHRGGAAPTDSSDPRLLSAASSIGSYGTNRLTPSAARLWILPLLIRDTLVENGPDDLVSVLPVFREEADEDTDGRVGRSWKDHHPVQTEAGRDRHHYPDHRFQRGDSRIQKHLLHSLGCWRPGQDQTSVETLLSEHTGPHLCGGQ